MKKNNLKIKEIKKSRNKQIKKLTKLRDLVVSTEWDMLQEANEKNDNISIKASNTVAEAAKNIQSAISQLILTDFSTINKNEVIKENKEVISSLKKVVLGK